QTVPEQDILSRPSAGSTRRLGPVASALPASMAASGAAVEALMPKTVDPALEARRKQAENEQADKRKAEEAKVAAAKAENCSRARTQMRSIDSGIRLARTNDQGEREILDDQQ